MNRKAKSASGMKRRDFIRTAGMIAGASAVLPVLPGFIPTSRKLTTHESGNYNSVLDIGVLLPTSLIYPDLAKNWLAGMEVYIEQGGNQLAGRKINLHKKAYGFGPYSAWQSAQKLIETDHVGLLTGIIGTSVSARLRQLLQTRRTMFFASHVGANMLRSEDHCPYIIHNSLNLWQANWALGEWTANNIGRTAVILSSFYDSGYDAVYAFQLGFEHAGGCVIHSGVTHNPALSETGVSFACEKILELQPDVVFAGYFGRESDDLLRIINSHGIPQRTQLAGSAFFTQSVAASGMALPNFRFYTCLPWRSDRKNAQNLHFQKAFLKNTGHPADLFALLGFETAHLVHTALEKLPQGLTDFHAITGVLEKSRIESPRGNLHLEKHSASITGPLHISQLMMNGTRISDDLITSAPPVSAQQALSTGLKTGWLNPYLCA